MPDYLTPDRFLIDIFASKSARQGGVIRRKRRDIERYYGVGPFLEEMRRRGFSVVENAGQFVIFCNCETLRRLS
ncbi:N-(5'-phosphoribosyl)anthranilate isomerase [Thalassococcus sp. BH17M4-6]|uniref:N-(5'-phosphoribosyl)anthranilate isomerase n=1 Tax=Thalassococcus sp. BH17M4-6 TaxID=3413148 RepID=UPI003BC7DF85